MEHWEEMAWNVFSFTGSISSYLIYRGTAKRDGGQKETRDGGREACTARKGEDKAGAPHGMCPLCADGERR